MADEDTDRQMTIPELLEARSIIRLRLEMGTGGSQVKVGTAARNDSAKEKLLTELEEIEAELAEQGYRDS